MGANSFHLKGIPFPKVHYENTSIQIYCKLYNPKQENFQIKNSDIFHIPAQNRLWVLVRTASPSRFYQVPTIYVVEQK